MRKLRAVLLFAVFLATAAAVFAQSSTEESITFTTYYPAPYGVYNEMRLYPHTSTSCNATQEGLMYYDGTNHKLQICSSSGSWADVGSAAPQHAVMFFNLTSCPAGWSEFEASRGRYVVSMQPGGLLGATEGGALSDQENRPAGAHSHSIGGESTSFPGGTTHVIFGTTGEPPGGSLSTDSGGLVVPGTNAPYIQLLACEKQ
jgi:hypothetical protein